MRRAILLLLRRLLLPLLLFAAFISICVLTYMHLEKLRWIDALFWTILPHAIDYQRVHDGTKLFALLVFLGVFAFQIWFAERILLSFFGHQGREVWKGMLNEFNLERIKDHFIICGYGQVGRTVVEHLMRCKIPFVLIETNEGLYRQILQENMVVLHGDAKRHGVLQSAGIARARGICVVIDNDADNLYITITARALNPNLKIITRAGQQRYAEAMRTSGATEVIIPEYEGGRMAGRMIETFASSAAPVRLSSQHQDPWHDAAT